MVSPPREPRFYISSTEPIPVSLSQDVQEWARSSLAEVTVTGMARYAGISQRTLNVAAEQLETTDLTIEAIARRVGLGSATNLRAHFAGTYGVPPAEYRRTFNQRTA